jgi:hypothetical protein
VCLDRACHFEPLCASSTHCSDLQPVPLHDMQHRSHTTAILHVTSTVAPDQGADRYYLVCASDVVVVTAVLTHAPFVAV